MEDNTCVNLSFLFDKTRSTKDFIDYDAYWILVRHAMAEVFYSPTFAIGYALRIGGWVTVMSFKVDLMTTNLTSVIEELYKIELSDDFQGWQVHNDTFLPK